MSTKEFIKKQVENFSKPLTPEQFSELSEAENSLIILEMPIKDYTLTEIARIVESNNAHVISLSTLDRKSTRLNSSHVRISYAVFCLKKKKKKKKKNKIKKKKKIKNQTHHTNIHNLQNMSQYRRNNVK